MTQKDDDERDASIMRIHDLSMSTDINLACTGRMAKNIVPVISECLMKEVERGVSVNTIVSSLCRVIGTMTRTVAHVHAKEGHEIELAKTMLAIQTDWAVGK